MTHEYHSTTTLNRIRAAHPCQEGWMKLLAHLGKTAADDEPLPLLTILDSNGMDDALWCLGADPALDRLKRHFQAWCAEQVLHMFEVEFPGDNRVRDQIAMLRSDDATDADRTTARNAAWVAVRVTTTEAAWAATWAATWDKASDAAEAAASAAAGEAAREAAAAAQEKQLRAMMEEQQ